MEINQKINYRDLIEFRQGYWEELAYCQTINKYLPTKNHYFNGRLQGFFEGDKNREYYFMCHCVDSKEVGCSRFQNSQYFYNKPGKKFGEEIEWK